MTNPQGARLDNIDQRLAQLVVVTERQAETAARQQANIERLAQSVERFAGIFADQAKAISDLSQTTREAVAASQRSAQASEAAAIVAQNNQNAIRDLIEELRRNR